MITSPEPPRAAGPAVLGRGFDVAIGLTGVAVAGSRDLARRAAVSLTPVADLLGRAPLLAQGHAVPTWLDAMAQRGADNRAAACRTLSQLLDDVVPSMLTALLSRVDLTATIQQHVDIDAVVRSVDLPAIVDRVDVDAVAERIDLSAIVDRVDVNAVAARIDLPPIVDRVDVNAVAERVDLSAIIDRVDLVGLAEKVINEIDLPAIIRESTGAMASDTIQGVRMQGIAGDEAVTRVVDRLRARRGRRPRPRLAEPDGPPGDHDGVPSMRGSGPTSPSP